VQVADWSVVGFGGVFVILSLIVRLTTHAKMLARSPDPKQRFRAFIGRTTPLFVGLGMLSGKVPELLGAPYPVVMVFDAVGFSLAIAMLLLLVRAARRLN
jgi:hypothetical protein